MRPDTKGFNASNPIYMVSEHLPLRSKITSSYLHAAEIMSSSAALSSTTSALSTSMASTFASSSISSSTPLGPPPQEKLTRENFLLWKAVMLLQIRGAQMEHHLDGKSQEPPATLTITREGKDEQVVNFT